MSEQKKHLGSYLYSLRIKRGYENISDFLRSFDLPMSDNYYRDVEAGRRTLGLEKAVELYKVLPFNDEDDNLEFFWQYFRDNLPEEIHSKLLVPRVDTSFKNVKEAREVLEYDLKIQRKAAALARFENLHIISDDVVKNLISKIHLLPLVHYIYMVNEASLDQVKNICIKNNIKEDDDFIDSFLTSAGVSIEKKGEKKKYRRNKPVFRVPRTSSGIKFKDDFLMMEVSKSLNKTRGPESFSKNLTFDYSGIFAINKESGEKLTDRVRDFISELNVSNKQLEEPSSVPFFVSVIISARDEYDANNYRQQEE